MLKKIQKPDWKWWKIWMPRYLEFEVTSASLIPKHRQIIHFVEGTKRTIENIWTKKTIKSGKRTGLKDIYESPRKTKRQTRRFDFPQW